MCSIAKPYLIPILVLLFVVMPTNAAAETPAFSTDSTTVLINIGGSSVGGGNRAPQSCPIHVTLINTTYIAYLIVTFTINIGTIDLWISNQNTGEYLYGEIDAEPGSQSIPISKVSGLYTISFALSDGTVFEGEFEL